jgi:hypothetical protein
MGNVRVKGPFVENLPSHIKDTTDYLKKMENLTIPENTMLVTMDVTSLYTNIPHDDDRNGLAWDPLE